MQSHLRVAHNADAVFCGHISVGRIQISSPSFCCKVNIELSRNVTRTRQCQITNIPNIYGTLKMQNSVHTHKIPKLIHQYTMKISIPSIFYFILIFLIPPNNTMEFLRKCFDWLPLWPFAEPEC
jgi:hypothetical protein